MNIVDEQEKLEREISLINKVRQFLKTEEGIFLLHIYEDIRENRIIDVLSSDRENLQKVQGELIAYTEIVDFIKQDQLSIHLKSRQNKLDEINNVDN